MSDPVEPSADAQLRKGRQLRYPIVAALGVVIALLVGGGIYDRIEARQACATAKRVRQHSEQLDKQLFTDLGERLRASPAEIESFMETIEAEYDAMPTPAAC